MMPNSGPDVSLKEDPESAAIKRWVRINDPWLLTYNDLRRLPPSLEKFKKNLRHNIKHEHSSLLPSRCHMEVPQD